MDWDRIRATDLMVLLNSFLPPGGLIKSVAIYPSEFGLQRMKEEEIKGPSELVESTPVDDDDGEEGTEGSRYHMEKLRQYQLNRLKYYYAVIVCDNETTANKIYTECDGLEYESSATKMDLRFIPDDMVFDQEPKEVCDKLPEPGKYQPRFFTTTALQQAKVNLTWDETDPNRIEITQKLASGKVDDIADTDLHAYLASSSDDEDDEADKNNDSEDDENTKLNSIDKYKALLQDIENSEKEKDKKDVEMEITWGIDLKEKTDKLIKKKLDEKEQKTPFQQYLEKCKEKKKAKREEHKKKLQSNKDEASENDSDIPSDIDMNDPYFAEEFDKPEFKKKKNKHVIDKLSDGGDNLKKAELELLLANDDDDNGKKHFSLKKIQERENENKTKKKLKNKKQKEEVEQDGDDFKINVTDDRFSALYSSHHFNVDPTDPHYKKTKGMEAIVKEKLKRKSEVDNPGEIKKVKSDTLSKDPELSVLIKSVKRKTEMLGNKKRK
ncbi:hypothetical protein ILUMI_09903 [Ignelater luminosus]|uniref:NUC153 domain-containing protein n=1 Tax=Ignelater luminosus TaxID=2038154 RepID=A0A8K0GFH7_IGNLU|nr:hypothetical protein ILUMI_09903 [Ignelater luminosus]